MRKSARSLAALTFPLLLASVLAGCAEEAPPVEPTDGLDLVADETTGVIRGLIVDSAIKPIGGALVTAACGDAELTTNSTEVGAFGFSRVPPGTCFLAASKPGFSTIQTTVEVEAGVLAPDIVKLQLQADASTAPFVDALLFKGFMECGVQSPVLGVAVCGLVNDLVENATNDNTQVRYALAPNIQWAQSEMVWTATNPLGEEMTLLHSYTCEGETLFCDMEASGKSPLLLAENATNVAILGLNEGTELYIRVFAEALKESKPPTDVCYPNPVLGGTSCVTGAGATLQQGFDIYTHVFHGFEPPVGWRFTVDGAPKVPN